MLWGKTYGANYGVEQSAKKKWIWLLVTVLSVAVWAWWTTQERTQEQANHAIIGTWLAVADDAQYICALSIVPTDIKATEPVMLARFELRERRADGYEGVLAEPVAVTVSGDRLYAYIPTNEKDGTRIPVGIWNEADHTPDYSSISLLCSRIPRCVHRRN